VVCVCGECVLYGAGGVSQDGESVLAWGWECVAVRVFRSRGGGVCVVRAWCEECGGECFVC